jgi:hypothetical protein
VMSCGSGEEQMSEHLSKQQTPRKEGNHEHPAAEPPPPPPPNMYSATPSIAYLAFRIGRIDGLQWVFFHTRPQVSLDLRTSSLEIHLVYRLRREWLQPGSASTCSPFEKFLVFDFFLILACGHFCEPMGIYLGTYTKKIKIKIHASPLPPSGEI